MVMADERKVLMDYYFFTVPQVSVFAGGILGILFILGIKTELALGIFALLYGLMLSILHIVVYNHFRSSWLYYAGLLGSIVLILSGLYLILLAF
jgi:hypothetical protein